MDATRFQAHFFAFSALSIMLRRPQRRCGLGRHRAAGASVFVNAICKAIRRTSLSELIGGCWSLAPSYA
jgi:hypothetical protein